jgi:transcription elongation factor Elf1
MTLEPVGETRAVTATCPLCHTADLLTTPDALAAGATWVCTTCGQRWSATRLETVAAYARYAAAR